MTDRGNNDVSRFPHHINTYEPAITHSAVGVLIAALLAVAVVALTALLVPSVPEPQYIPIFKLPLTSLSCLEYHMADGEIFADWDLYQPITIHVDHGGAIAGVTWHADSGCPMVVGS